MPVNDKILTKIVPDGNRKKIYFYVSTKIEKALIYNLYMYARHMFGHILGKSHEVHKNSKKQIMTPLIPKAKEHSFLIPGNSFSLSSNFMNCYAVSTTFTKDIAPSNLRRLATWHLYFAISQEMYLL